MGPSMKKSVTILEVGFGNLPSLDRVLNQLSVGTNNIESAQDILEAEYLMIPGVGSFETAMNYLNQNNYGQALKKRALELKLPTLGICLGAQIMFDMGQEGTIMKGLSIFNGTVENLTNKLVQKKSHTGWDKVKFRQDFLGISKNKSVDLFFNHDYIMIPDNKDDISAECDFGGSFAVALKKYNCYAVQFHPEKSQESGLTILRNFLGLIHV
jgi:imidazole glycerol phosphate synthase glutamine amidotransferase subunit